MYINEGASSLFKGLGPNLVGVIPARSINFSLMVPQRIFTWEFSPTNSIKVQDKKKLGYI